MARKLYEQVKKLKRNDRTLNIPHEEERFSSANRLHSPTASEPKKVAAQASAFVKNGTASTKTSATVNKNESKPSSSQTVEATNATKTASLPNGYDEALFKKLYAMLSGVSNQAQNDAKTQVTAAKAAAENAKRWDLPNAETYSAPPVYSPSKQELTADISASLRPGYEQAMLGRRRASEENMAEIDADAASRGMGRSTFVSSMKMRELADASSDIASLEGDYNKTLAAKVLEYMKYYTGLANTNRENAAERAFMREKYESESADVALQNAQKSKNDALTLAARLYEAMYKKAETLDDRTAKAQESEAEASANKQVEYEREEYEKYVRNLDADKRDALFNSTASYWAVRREQLKQIFGEDYSKLVSKYTKKSNAFGGGGKWNNTRY